MPEACAPEVQFFRMLNRIVEPRVRAGWGSPRLVPGGLIVLETRGRSSGRRSRVPLAALRWNDHLLVSTFRGLRAGWVRNLSVNPAVRYWLRGRPRQATALVISADRREVAAGALPAPLRLLARSLVPYTYAGWAFALLVPAGAAGADAQARRPRA